MTNGYVVGETAVVVKALITVHGWKQSRNRAARKQRALKLAVGEQLGHATMQVYGHRPERQREVLNQVKAAELRANVERQRVVREQAEAGSAPA